MTVAGLIADIGGTNARFALVGEDGETQEIVVLRCADHAGPYPAQPRPNRALAVLL